MPTPRGAGQPAPTPRTRLRAGRGPSLPDPVHSGPASLGPRPPPGRGVPGPRPPARRPPVPRGSAAAERGLREPREGGRGQRPRRRFARSGNGQPSTSAPYCAAPPPGLQYGRRGGAKRLQPFPLLVPAPRPLAGRSSRRKSRKRRKCATRRRRRRVLRLPAPTTSAPELAIARRLGLETTPLSDQRANGGGLCWLLRETFRGKMAAASQRSPTLRLQRRDAPGRPPQDGNGCRPGTGHGPP